MKGIILYQSKSGATKRYADWLIEKTGFDRDETNRKKGVCRCVSASYYADYSLFNFNR
jgi:hypothetical protein